MPADQGIVDSVANANIKNLGDGPAFYAGLAMSNSVSHQNRLQILAESALGQITKKATEVDITEAISILKATSGNEVASTLANLAAALSSSQQGVKAAQTTPPVTP